MGSTFDSGTGHNNLLYGLPPPLFKGQLYTFQTVYYSGAYPGFTEGGGRDPPNKLTSQTSAPLSYFSLGLPV